MTISASCSESAFISGSDQFYNCFHDFSIRLQRGAQNTKRNPARFARQNVDFTRVSTLLPKRMGPGFSKFRRASRAEALVLLGFPSFLPHKGVQNPKTRRASRAETLSLLRFPCCLPQQRGPKP